MGIEVSVSSLLGELDHEEVLALAGVDMELKRIDQALIKIKHILKSDKENSKALALGAKIYAQLRLFEKAKTCFKQYLEINPDSLIDKFQFGMVHFDSGDHESALAIWNELLEKQPTHPPTLFYKGLALAQSNNMADARSTLAILLQSAPADNLYFGQAKELLQAIDKGGAIKTGDGKSIGDNAKSMPEDAYKVIN